jgi:hypothetical protein
MIKSRNTSPPLKLALVSGLLSLSASACLLAQGEEEERWFQIEVSIFSNEEAADRYEEQWQADRTKLGYPASLRRLDELMDLLMIDDLRAESPIDDGGFDALEQFSSAIDVSVAPTKAENRTAALLSTGPQPQRIGAGFNFYDLQRDAFVHLPLSESDFLQTNRAIDRSADHRLLFQGLWRQVVPAQEAATPIYIEGGLQYGDQHELQGSLSMRFNQNQDRVVADVNLWLTEFGVIVGPDTSWKLPSVPTGLGGPQQSGVLDPLSQLNQSGEFSVSSQQPTYFPNRVFHLQQSRDMRSTEFHYVDHPALGLVIMVEPYEVPEIPLPEFEFELER